MKLCMMSSVFGYNAPEIAVRTALRCKMEAVDWIFPHDAGIDPLYLKKLTQDTGLRVAAYTMLDKSFIRHQPEWKEHLLRGIENAVTLGAPMMMLPPFGNGNTDQLTPVRREWIDFYTWALPRVQEAGMALSMEPTGMPDSPVVTIEEIQEVLNAVPGLKLTLDYGNMVTAGNADHAAVEFQEQIIHFHLKDWKIFSAPAPNALKKRCGKYFANAMIGTGDLDLRKFWQSVPEKVKNCFVDLETADFSGKMSPEEALKFVSEELRGW